MQKSEEGNGMLFQDCDSRHTVWFTPQSQHSNDDQALFGQDHFTIATN